MTGLSILLGGCLGTRNIAIPNGATGVVTGKGRATVAFPDAKGELTPGAYDLQPGDLVRRPKSDQEVIDTLKAAGVKVNPNPGD